MTYHRPHRAPFYRIAVLRPNGAPYQAEDHAFAKPENIEHRCAELRGRIRAERGWTPSFRVYYGTPDAHGEIKVQDVTRLLRVN